MLRVEQFPVTELKGVGPRAKELLQQLGITNAQELLFHLPIRYEDRTRITPITSARVGDKIIVEGEVRNVRVVRGRRAMLLYELHDDTGMILVRLFHFNGSQLKNLQREDLKLRCFGLTHQARNGQLEMSHPEYQAIEELGQLPLAQTLTPIYPITKGLNQNIIRKALDQVLAMLGQQLELEELLPAQLFAEAGVVEVMPSLRESLEFIHHPPIGTDLPALLQAEHPALQRLVLEELVANRLALRTLRQQFQSHHAPAFSASDQLAPQLLASLPFALTGAQQRVVKEIAEDLACTKPMLRLVQGDVGAGKTLVALLAALQVIEGGGQVALMAPTEILAQQHFEKFMTLLKPLNINVQFLVGSISAKNRQPILEQIENGQAQLVVGTHALFQKTVTFKNLALAIIDEQHRFGVHQRLALSDKGSENKLRAHQLIMTATPIPRTLTMTSYADLDVSVIDELPPGRKPIKTLLFDLDRKGELIEKVRQNALEGKQVYWVCTLIEESESLQAQAAEDLAQQLKQQLKELKIGLVHGRMKPKEKELVMQQFKNNQINILVATTVIEVGVDVPNASLMIIENAERLGLSQLHQLRGRVGRGTQQSFCVLLYQKPLSDIAKQRLEIMRDSQDGFEIAQQDLLMRGPGEILGTRQAGYAHLRVANLLRDQLLLPKVALLTAILLRDYPALASRLVDCWVGHSRLLARA